MVRIENIPIVSRSLGKELMPLSRFPINGKTQAIQPTHADKNRGPLILSDDKVDTAARSSSHARGVHALVDK